MRPLLSCHPAVQPLTQFFMETSSGAQRHFKELRFRPITIDENVCIRLTEVASNWSGVLRFGVTNVDPDSYRNVAVPK